MDYYKEEKKENNPHYSQNNRGLSPINTFNAAWAIGGTTVVGFSIRTVLIILYKMIIIIISNNTIFIESQFSQKYIVSVLF